jgi:ABC-2 type transport system permease protein
VPVYDRRYRGFPGERRPSRWLFLTITRLGLKEVFDSKLILSLFIFSCLPLVVFSTVVYVANNLDVLSAFQVTNGDASQLLESLEGSFFFWFLVVQSMFAFLLASFTGPQLVGPDLVHGAMPLYLSRPISRADYVLGKLCVLVALLSAVTWVPAMILAGIQASVAREGWLADRWRIPFALFVGSWIWILLLALLALAISAWIRWRPLATSALFIVFVVGGAFGAAINETLDTNWGKLLMLGEMAQTIWVGLFGDMPFMGSAAARDPLPLGACWLGLVGASLAALGILHKKIRAFEVVR